MGGGAVVEGFKRADTKETDSHCLPSCLPAYLLGVSELGWPRKGNSSLTLPVSAAAWFLPCCYTHTHTHTHTDTHKGRPANPHHMQIVGKFTSVSF